MKLEKLNHGDDRQYAYLSVKDSIRYDEVKDSEDPRDIEIRDLILAKAKASRGSHRSSKY